MRTFFAIFSRFSRRSRKSRREISRREISRFLSRKIGRFSRVETREILRKFRALLAKLALFRGRSREKIAISQNREIHVFLRISQKTVRMRTVFCGRFARKSPLAIFRAPIIIIIFVYLSFFFLFLGRFGQLAKSALKIRPIFGLRASSIEPPERPEKTLKKRPKLDPFGYPNTSRPPVLGLIPESGTRSSIDTRPGIGTRAGVRPGYSIRAVPRVWHKVWHQGSGNRQ